MSRTFVIAEAGSCHDGDLDKAKRLIVVANACFADSVKFQFWSSPERLAERRHAPEYLETYRRYQLPAVWLPTLKAYADTFGIEFMCTAYLPEDLEVIAPFVQRFKISSFESSDCAFVKAHERYRKPLIISLGMSGATDRIAFPLVDNRVDWLHCVSAYPAPIEELNLNRLGHTLCSGFSDHSGHVLAGAVAVARGAEILEVHFRLDDTDPANPDCAAALSPWQLTEYILNVRDAERMLGDGKKRVMPSEVAMAKHRVTS